MTTPITTAIFRRNYRTIGQQVWRRVNPFGNGVNTPRFHALHAARITEVSHLGLAQHPYYSPVLMAHLKTHLPNWPGFMAEYRTSVTAAWNSIYGDVDWPTAQLVGAAVEQPLGQRDRLFQIFDACPPGSYGFYAKKGLSPFKAVVGSAFASTIDEFFAANVHILKQEFSPSTNDFMSEAETAFWNSEQDLFNWLAGKTFTKRMRELGVQVPAIVDQIWSGKKTPDLPPGEALAEAQIQEAKALLQKELPNLDQEALKVYCRELWDKLPKDKKPPT